MRIVFLTGMSGAGRSTAAKALEDEGFHVMDNLPPSLVSEAIHALSPRLNKIAIVLDIRGGSLSEMEDALTEIKAKRLDIATLFLDADNSELVQRFEGSRRPHPLQNQSGLLFAIEQEREMQAYTVLGLNPSKHLPICPTEAVMQYLTLSKCLLKPMCISASKTQACACLTVHHSSNEHDSAHMHK